MKLKSAALAALCAAGLISSSVFAVQLPIERAGWQLPHYGTNVQVVPQGPGGEKVFKLVTPIRNGAQQIRRPLIYSADVAHVVFTGKLKTQDVSPGAGTAEECRAHPVFLDLNGDRVGDWPAGELARGTTDWKAFNREYKCPPKTRVVEIWLGMFNSTGTAWFDDVNVTAYDASGKELTPTMGAVSVQTDKTGWTAFESGTEDTSRPLVVDFSKFIPAPAGQFGFVRPKDGHLVFENGGRARFYGTGFIKDWCPPKDQAPAIAEAFARGGINLVRLHGMDAMDPDKTIFDKTSPKTDRLDPDKMDRLDFLVSELKKRGVYVDLNLLTKRHYKSADGVQDVDHLPQGGKAISMFDPTMIQLQKDYDKLILTHKNPYTGLAYKDDPVVAMLEIVNECSLMDLDFGGGLPKNYDEALNNLFLQWCDENKIDRPKERYAALVKKKAELAARFAEATEKKYFDDQFAYLTHDLGIRIPISGTSTDGTYGERRAQFETTLFDRHAYWDHPSGGWDPFCIFNNKPMTKVVSKWNMLDYLLGSRVAGKPFMVSEWNTCWPNDYVGEGPLIIGTYAGYNDWDASMIFGTGGLAWNTNMHGTFDSENKPHVMLPLMATAFAFYRGDVTPGPIVAINANKVPANASLIRRFSRVELFTKQCVLVDSDEKATRPPEKGADDLPSEYKTDDGQIDWTEAGKFVLNTARTQAVLGFVSGDPVSTKDLTVTTGAPFAQVIVTSLNDEPIASAPRLLLSATARAENAGQVFRAFRKGLEKLGAGPILMEPTKAKIELRHQGNQPPTVHLLDAYGRRTDKTVAAQSASAGTWNIDLTNQPAGWFEVSFEQK